MKKTDSQLQHDVVAELEWESRVDHADVGVSVHDGVVTLSGYVKSYPEKRAAEKAAERVAGVVAIAEDIKVRFSFDPKVADHEIAKRIVDLFTWNVVIPEDKIKVKVERGWVTLTGEVEAKFQADEAKKVAGRISGVTGISNMLVVRGTPSATDVKERIASAFKRQANLDAASVTVSTDGSTVKLGGKVKAWNERRIAERVAWAAPGVTNVEDEIMIAY